MRGAPPPERVPVAGIDLLAALNPVALPWSRCCAARKEYFTYGRALWYKRANECFTYYRHPWYFRPHG